MDWTSANLVQVIQYLLPGFVAACLYYSLTAHPKRSPFERVVQALIFTVIAQLMTAGVRWGLEGIGQLASIGRWTTNVAQAWSLLNASVVGVGFASISNRNLFHSFCYRFGITSRTSHPSEWFSAFHRDKRFVILHLKDNRRVHGWPEEWPDHPDAGHFVLMQASWLLDSGDSASMHAVERLLIPATDVGMVELMRTNDEITADAEELEATERLLLGTYDEEESDGEQGTTATATEEHGEQRRATEAAARVAAATETERQLNGDDHEPKRITAAATGVGQAGDSEGADGTHRSPEKRRPR
ncbi:MAG: DUF6338 family protein [Planctomycetota bacterium]